MKNNKNSGIGGFFAGKGFYAALAVCLLGAVAAAWVTVDRTISSINEQDNVPQVENRVISDENYDAKDSVFASEDVGKPKEDVKIEDEPEASVPEESTFNFVTKTAKFTMPLEGETIGSHSAGELVKYEALGEWRTHDGIDIAGDIGAEIKAVSDGKVTAVTNDPLWGTVVEITHDGNIISIYSGLAPEVSVAAGDEVKGGDVIGTLGETNLAEVDKASHLHFAMKENGKFIDPKTKIK
ncbi:MAG: M23 family metallopeptidase [Oscillospiraceae bacterium]|nr:M23 family metallopeptidase [Oscillospiraceae bacterium]